LVGFLAYFSDVIRKIRNYLSIKSVLSMFFGAEVYDADRGKQIV